MKKIDGLFFFIIAGFVVLVCLINLWLSQVTENNSGREYRVSVNRIEQAIADYEQSKGKAPGSLQELIEFAGVEDYPGITGLYVMPAEDSTNQALSAFVAEEEDDYLLFVTDHNCYKVTYVLRAAFGKQFRVLINGILLLVFVFLSVVLLYIRQKILLPFHQLSDIPYELAKGNLTVPLQENKGKLFGRYVWGMDLLREHLEQSRQRELEFQKEKKMLLLALSHDIKTPLSTVKLYAKALSRELYKEESKKKEIAENINGKVDEIESYISEIVRASREDFLHFEVENGEFYIKEVLEQINEYYVEKMKLNQIEFRMADYQNCLLYGDADRLVEVLQNVIENSMKYGDGKKIWMEFERSEEEYEIQICNTGCDLDSKELPHLFDSFFRGSNVGKKPGSGLGLYICRQLMQQMEGGITASVGQDEHTAVMVIHVLLRCA